MDEFGLVHVAEYPLDRRAACAHDAARLLGAVIHQAAGHFDAVLVDTGDDGAARKLTLDRRHANRQQAAPGLAQHLHRPGIER